MALEETTFKFVYLRYVWVVDLKITSHKKVARLMNFTMKRQIAYYTNSLRGHLFHKSVFNFTTDYFYNAN